jgi:hypothetical protein
MKATIGTRACDIENGSGAHNQVRGRALRFFDYSEGARHRHGQFNDGDFPLHHLVSRKECADLLFGHLFELAFRRGQYVAFAGNPDVERGQQVDAEQQGQQQAADNYDREGLLRIRADSA